MTNTEVDCSGLSTEDCAQLVADIRSGRRKPSSRKGSSSSTGTTRTTTTKRGRKCSVCALDPEILGEVNVTIATNFASFRVIAEQHGVTHDAVRRHAASHVPSAIRAMAAQNQELVDAAAADQLHRMLTTVRENAEYLATTPGKQQISALHLLLRWVEVAGRVRGYLSAGDEDRIDLVQIGIRLADALRGHPEAKLLAAGVLAQLEDGEQRTTA